MPGGTKIKIDTNIMMSAAKIIDNQRAIIENGFSSVYQDAVALKDYWEGESAAYYQETMKKKTDPQDSKAMSVYIVNVLREYALDLNKIAEEFDAAEQELSAVNEALPSDVFGI